MGFGGRFSKYACSTEELAPLQGGSYYHDHKKNQNTFTFPLIALVTRRNNRPYKAIISEFSLITTMPLGMFGRD
jgi:hypothetical protein